VWKKRDLLNQYISVYPYHWWQGWNLVSPPYVETIVFNFSRTKATLKFAVGYEGGEAIMEKKGSEWVLKEHKPIWIE